MIARKVDGPGKKANGVIALCITIILCLSFIISNPGQSATGPAEEPRIPYDGDYVVSYDESTNLNHALHPDVAVTPRTAGSIGGSIHVVWDEMDEVGGYREIHYSMSEDRGKSWSNDEPAEDDRMISWNQKKKANHYGDAVNPSIAIDSQGVIHVVWAEKFNETGFYTWEIFYSRSSDNGKTWTGDTAGDTIISYRLNEHNDATWVSAPKIAISLSNGKASDILHVVWSEYTEKDGQDVHYSTSVNGGDTWSGSTKNQILGIPGGLYAYDPVVVTSGDTGKFVHVAWMQEFSYKAPTYEIYYVRSDNFGQEWPQREDAISDPGIPATIGSISATAGLQHDVYIAWNQTVNTNPPLKGIFMACSFNDGNDWAVKEQIINDPSDENPPGVPSIGVTRESAKAPYVEVQVVWPEFDDKSPVGTIEVHNSMSREPMDPNSWTGQKDDIVLSWPDDEPTANVANVSIAMGFIDGEWMPQIVWDELNYYKSKDKAQHNNEIHTIQQFTLTLIINGSGSVDLDPLGPMYSSGTVVTLDANPNAGWYFDHWGGDMSGGSNPGSLTMDSDKTVYVYFTQYQYTLTITISPTGSGTVTKNPDQATYTYGTVVTLTAYANVGYHFDHWGGAISGSANPTTITMYGNRAVTAYFVLNEYTLATSVTGSGSITKNPDQPTYSYGTVVNVTAVPTSGWEFTTWGGDLGGSTNPTTITMNSNKSISATFVQITFTAPLASGWHLISVPLIQSNVTLASILSSISGKYDVVQAYNASDNSDHWKTYSTFKPSSQNDLANINHTMGFWLHTTMACNLTVYGPRPTSTNINLKAGWNLVGYPARNDSTYNVTQLKASTGATKVEGIDLTSPYRTKELLGNEILKRGRAYWVLVPSDTIWTVNW